MSFPIRFACWISLLLIFSSTVVAQTDQSEATKKVTVVVADTNFDSGDPADANAENVGTEDATVSGSITVVINGKKHEFALDADGETFSQSFRKVVKDGENILAVISGSVMADKEKPADGSTDDEPKDPDQSPSDSDVTTRIEGLDDLPADIRKQLKSIMADMPNLREGSDAMKVQIKKLHGLPQISLQGIDVSGLDDLPETVRKQVSEAMQKATELSKGKMKVLGDTSAHFFEIKDGKIISRSTTKSHSSSGGGTTKPDSTNEENMQSIELIDKLDAILQRLDRIENAVEELRGRSGE